MAKGNNVRKNDLLRTMKRVEQCNCAFPDMSAPKHEGINFPAALKQKSDARVLPLRDLPGKANEMDYGITKPLTFSQVHSYIISYIVPLATGMPPCFKVFIRHRDHAASR